MLHALGASIARFARRFMPDPFVFAVLLALVTLALALALGDFHASDPLPFTRKLLLLLDAARSPSGGIWKFLAFSMQMCLVLVTGHALASAGPVRRGLDAIATIPRTPASGAALVAAVACTTAVLNWGFGLIAGAILARDVDKALASRGHTGHAPLLAASGFTGLMVWHGGLSGSAPLTSTTIESARNVLPARTVDLLIAKGYAAGVPLTQTIFSPLNLAVTLGLLVLVPLTMALLAPRVPAPTARASAPSTVHGERHDARRPRTLVEWLEGTRVVNVLIALPLLAGVARFGIADDLRRFGINEVNALLLGVGLLLHASPRSYAAAAEDAAKGCAGIIVQFPIYAGIMAVFESSGLLRQVAEAILSHAPRGLVPYLSFLAGCLINIFVPSGGAQWGVQGPIALEAGLGSGHAPGVMIMSVAYGDQTTNMIQPFWALPLLSITKAKAGDVVGYCTVAMLAGIAWITLAMLVLA